MVKSLVGIFCLIVGIAFVPNVHPEDNRPFVLVLGTAQDGGYPHLGCLRQCCTRAWTSDSLKRFVASIALVDPASKKWWLFEATPDIREQFQYFRVLTDSAYEYLPNGIFLSHAHIGHYTGLTHLGREVMSTKEMPVFVLPRMKKYLESNGPWSQLVELQNIRIVELRSNITLIPDIRVECFTVPHRDEFSETAGFRVVAGEKKYLFIPDIDKWGKWDKNIVEEVRGVDYAFVDGTFYAEGELPNRNMNEVPHPFISETMKLFGRLDPVTKSKLRFIHLNHSNPLLWDERTQIHVEQLGFSLAKQGGKY